MAISRRRFLQHSAAIAAATLPLATATTAYGANERVRVGVVGLNGRGRSHLKGFEGNVVAICDCDLNVMGRVGEKLGEVDLVQDFRNLLDRADIDVIAIATPNHWHALMSIWAAQAGKDVYVEKPVSHNVWEGRQIVNAARKYGRMIQTGTQIRSSGSIKDAVEFVQSGKLGAIQYIVGTCFKRRGSIGKLDKPLVIPDHVDYDLWCGPAEKRELFRPKMHYDWHWDFNTGNGDMGNQGIHQMDVCRWFLGAEELSPRVMSLGGRLGYRDAADTPNTQTVIHDYDKAPIIFETRGLETPPYRDSRVGIVVQCEQGHVLVPTYHDAMAFDPDGKEIKRWTHYGNHYGNFLAAVKSRNHEDLNADILEGHLSSALCHTGNISYRLGEKQPLAEITAAVAENPQMSASLARIVEHLKANQVDVSGPTLTIGPWLSMDPQTERFTDNAAANEMLTRPYRSGFEVPDLSA
ncbi:MAG: gfo/Idh/MocA family oxidoreductase [Planctomycetota bacterium]|nr:MAG: gfo/Idh/MocA family oxidoreductase [Planctomycetota bacterium]REJ98796.1 MAG: gfo/Idh/MocA family oxidoreductase [Planctomycetota bacterium]REK27641.1 MAG: gfo/Idh/MocA family oxidoreductase [Planctomycetota bacterium]REK43252.1 MAG: gfo/Idh/MocA family oxidoreductase [Planctomycetota bacterium]